MSILAYFFFNVLLKFGELWALLLIIRCSSSFTTKDLLHFQLLTRNCARIHAQVGTTEASYRTFGYRGIYIWNHISQKKITEIHYPCFKNIVKVYIQNNNGIFHYIVLYILV